MARLFIIGNGYDLAKGKNTTYYDFKKWLRTAFPFKNFYFLRYYNFFKRKPNYARIINESGEYNAEFLECIYKKNKETELIKKKRLAAASALLLEFMRVNGDNWQDFERELGKLDVLKIKRECDTALEKRNIKKNCKKWSPVDESTEVLTSFNWEFQKLFALWITEAENKRYIRKRRLGRKNRDDNLKCPHAFETKIIKTIKNDDTFIIFNYTSTVEDYFSNNDKTIFYHVHGSVKDGTEIIVGHGSDTIDEKGLNDDSGYIALLYNSLQKNTKGIIQRNNALWNRITNNSKKAEPFQIYEYGFSYAEVDQPYIKQIAESVKEGTVELYLNNYKGSGEWKKDIWENFGVKSDKIKYYIETEDNDLDFIDA